MAATVGCVAAAVPVLATPTLAGDVGADTSLNAKSFRLLVATHKEQRRANNEAKTRSYLEEWGKRRKRRKKKVPESSRPSPTRSSRMKIWTSSSCLLPGSHLFGVCFASGVQEYGKFLGDDYWLVPILVRM